MPLHLVVRDENLHVACKFLHLDALAKATAKKCMYVNLYELFNVFFCHVYSSLRSDFL